MPTMFPVLASSSSTTSSGGSAVMLIAMVAVLAVFWLLVIRPENKKKKAANEMRSALKPGDEITTIGGIVGTICAVKEETIVIETGADRVRIEFTKWAVSSRGKQSSQDASSAQTGTEEKQGEKKGLFGRKKDESGEKKDQ